MFSSSEGEGLLLMMCSLLSSTEISNLTILVFGMFLAAHKVPLGIAVRYLEREVKRR